jgi:hypothetical protein
VVDVPGRPLAVNWDATYGETDEGVPVVAHNMSSPIESLAGTIKEGFESTRHKRLMGNTGATVEGTIFNLLSEGSD